ncbi:hypothetical protein PIB30_067306 [Stylosanthes scabra]|uniref:non-specific serine/threonine protein kinase n=1 Tax=Stylosanthes scabra TaxID=79078 RepID=A0ABU6XNA4_9FABA|nr:hypothetical protein [Stylosanthes scabra]
MSDTSPSPAASGATQSPQQPPPSPPPASGATQPPQQPPSPPASPAPNTSASPPPSSSTPPPSTSTTPSQSSPPTTTTPSSPPPTVPPPVQPSPQPSKPPPPASPLPSSGNPPPSRAPPPTPPQSDPPQSPPPSPPQPSPVPPRSSPLPSNPPPTPPSNPPKSTSPPPKSPPPENSPSPVTSPPPTAVPPPRGSPPPPPPKTSPPPQPSVPPPVNSSPPSPASVPPPRSSPPPASMPPSRNSPPPSISPPTTAPPPPPPTAPSTQPIPPSNSTPQSSSSPPPPNRLAPPPASILTPPRNGSQTENSGPTAGGGGNGIGAAAIVAISAVAGILLFGIIGVAIWCMMKRKKKKVLSNGGYVMPTNPASSPDSAPLVQSGSSSDVLYTPSDPGGLGHSRSWFSYEELIKATDGFSTENLLGEGGFGSVYKGYLPDGREIAVKQLKIGGGQGEKEFKAEVEIISRIHHRHLVSLVGYCIQDTRRLLVYDYVPNNTLYFHLHGESRPVLEWANRVKIAAGAARGIDYLHEDCNPRIIHRDIKSSNILLDYNFEAKVSDFGLAKLALDANTHITTRVMGTFGYVAPEYASSGKLTEKSDVYSFGVVLLELITGRKPVDTSQPVGDESLVEWARPLLSHVLDSGELGILTDPRLEKNYVESEMFCMIEVAASCVRHSAAKRPRMGQVVRAFDSLGASDLTNGLRVGESEAFNSGQLSEEIRLFRRMAFGDQNYTTDFFSQDSLNT